MICPSLQIWSGRRQWGGNWAPKSQRLVSPSLPRNRNRRACPAVCPAVCPAACPAVRFLFRNTQHEWSGRRFLPLTGELAVSTICRDCFCVLRPRFDKARKCLLSISIPGFVARHKVHKIVHRKVPHSVVSLHATQARIVSQLQGNFHLARVCQCSCIKAFVLFVFLFAFVKCVWGQGLE